MAERSGANLLDKIRVTLATAAITAVVTSAYWVIRYDLFGTQTKVGNSVAPMAKVQGSTASPAAPKKQAAPRIALEPVTPVQVGVLAIPVVGVKVSQLFDTYNDTRDKGLRIHDAIDIMAPRGTPVIAAGPGKVEKIWASEKGGNTVYVRSADRKVVYYYAHLDGYAASLHEGDTLRAGDPIGTVGSTGNASPDGPHLHFAVMVTDPTGSWSSGLAVNPYPLLTATPQR